MKKTIHVLITSSKRPRSIKLMLSILHLKNLHSTTRCRGLCSGVSYKHLLGIQYWDTRWEKIDATRVFLLKNSLWALLMFLVMKEHATLTLDEALNFSFICLVANLKQNCTKCSSLPQWVQVYLTLCLAFDVEATFAFIVLVDNIIPADLKTIFLGSFVTSNLPLQSDLTTVGAWVFEWA